MSQQINLYNPIFRPRRMAPASAAALLGAFVIVCLGAGLYAAYQNQRTAAAAQEAKAISDESAGLAARRDQLVKQQAALKSDPALRDELTLLEWRMKGRQDVLDALNSGVVGSTRGYADFLRAFSRQAVEGLWLTGLEIASSGNEMKIQGRALSGDLLPAYLARLNQEPALQGRRFAELRIDPPKADPAPAAREASPKDDKKGVTAGAAGKGTPTMARPRFVEFTLISSPAGGTARPTITAAGQNAASGAAR